MNEEIIRALSAELKITEDQIRNTLEMLSQGDTVPFIARYRKEQTKGLDEEQILVIQKQYDYQLKLAERKEDVIRLISEQGKLTDVCRKRKPGPLSRSRRGSRGLRISCSLSLRKAPWSRRQKNT